MRWLRSPILLGLAVLSLAVTACGSSGSSSGSSSSTASYNIMGFFPLTGTAGFMTQFVNTFQATVDQINASGGVHGHKLKAIVCDTGETANGGITCAREAIADKAFGVVSFAELGEYEALLQSAGIPDLNDLTDPLFYNNPVSFPVFAGGNVFFAGYVATAHHIGCTKMTLINAFTQTTAADQIEDTALSETAKPLGVTVTSSVIVPSTTVDMSAAVARALSYKPGCVAVQGSGSNVDATIQALHSSDPAVKIIIGEGFMPPGQIESLSPALAASLDLFDTSYQEADTSHSGVLAWLYTVNHYSTNPKALVSSGATIWTATKVLAEAASNVNVVNAHNVDAYLNGNHTFDFGVDPAVNFTKPVKPNPFGDRIFAACVIRTQYANSAYHSVGQFYNVFNGKPCSG